MQVEIENLGMGLSNCINSVWKRFNVGHTRDFANKLFHIRTHRTSAAGTVRKVAHTKPILVHVYKGSSQEQCTGCDIEKWGHFVPVSWHTNSNELNFPPHVGGKKLTFSPKRAYHHTRKTVAETLWPQRYDLPLCPCYMSSLFVPALWPHCMKLLYVLALCPTPSRHFLFPLYVPTFCPLFMFPLYVPITASVLQPKGFKRQSCAITHHRFVGMPLTSGLELLRRLHVIYFYTSIN